MPGWTRTPGFTAVKYAAGGGFPDAAIAGPIGGKANFFAGGPNAATSSATQVVNVTRFKAPIDAGQRVATLSAFLGGYETHGDSMSVTATFLSEAGKKLGVLKIGPVTVGRTGAGHRADPEVGEQARAEEDAVDPGEARSQAGDSELQRRVCGQRLADAGRTLDRPGESWSSGAMFTSPWRTNCPRHRPQRRPRTAGLRCLKPKAGAWNRSR